MINKILPAIKTNHTGLMSPVKKLAPYVLGLGLLMSAGTAKAESLKSDKFQKETTETTGPDKHLIGEGILGFGLLTFIGLGLYTNLSKKKEDSENKQ